jgi:lipopolysaccharide transport protein LptA
LIVRSFRNDILQDLFTVVIVMSVLCFSYDMYAEEPNREKSPLEITSNSMTIEEKSNIITFIGSVVAKKDSITIYSDTMVVHYSQGKEIKNVLATGNVKLLQDEKEIRSDKAEYIPDEEKVVFSGDPVFTERQNIVTGSMITYIIPSGKSIVENSKVILR